MAAMSVIGIDFGNESCYVAVAKSGGIETIANDYSLRATPSCIAFSGKNRILGVAAKNQQITNMKNTIFGIKRLLGRKFRDPRVQNEIKHLPYTILETSNGNIGVKVNYMQEEHIFSPEQCLAMLLTKLKETSEAALQTPINDCVIGVPSYFTNNERKALLDSAAIAGLNVLRLFNETTATALAYGIYKQDLPAAEEKPRNIVFVDLGHSSLQAAACAFHKGKLRMLATAADPDLGSRDIDNILAENFCKEFQQNYKINARTNPRALVRLLAETEKLKKQMSANSTTLPLGIECFMDDKDVKSQIKRADMEEMCAGLFTRVEKTLLKCLDQSGLQLEEIHSVEIVGGSSRIPAVKQLIEKVFGRTPSTTLNQDEAVSRGCALQCAMLSPAVRVRDFSVTDVQNYPISVNWDASGDGEAQGEIEVFPANHAVPFSKMLTFYRREPFAVRASYTSDIPYPDNKIGQWIVKDIRPTSEGDAQKVKVKVRVNLHGIMTVSSASMYEKKDAADAAEEEAAGGNGAAAAEQNDAAQQQTAPPAATPDGPQAPPPASSSAEDSKENDGDKKKKKQSVKSIELPIEPLTFGFSQVELNSYTEQELKMIAADRQEKERADARNALEEYVYELRGKLCSEDDLALFVVDTERESLIRQLDDMENWLYEEGEDCNRQVYQDKLVALKTLGEPIQTRRIEYDVRPSCLDDFARSLQLGRKAVEQCKANDPKYAHLSYEDVAKVEQAVNQSFRWLEDARAKLVASARHLPPPITVAQIRQEKTSFEQLVSPILNKPPPPPKAQPPSPPKDGDKNDASAPTEQEQNNSTGSGNKQQAEQPQTNSQTGEKMDWS